MSVRILHDERQEQAALYCSTSDFAFGPVFYNGSDGKDASERAEAFLRCLPEFGHGSDPRGLTPHALEGVYVRWLAQEADQYRREEDEKRIASAESMEYR